MAFYLCPCRKCHSGLRLWRRQHAEQKYVCPSPLSDGENRVGLVDGHARTSFCHHTKGNGFALIMLIKMFQFLFQMICMVSI